MFLCTQWGNNDNNYNNNNNYSTFSDVSLQTCQGEEWIPVSQNSDKERIFMKAVMNFEVHKRPTERMLVLLKKDCAV